MTPNVFLKNRPCVYGIRNLVNNKVYVGKTKCIHKRCHQYVYDFRHRAIGHLNDHLFNSMCKHGIEKFEMFPLEFCDVSMLAERELYWMVALGSLFKNRGYNLRADSSTGIMVSEETSAKISKNLKRQWSNGVRDDHSGKLKAAWVGRRDWKDVAANTLRRSITKWKYDVVMPNGDFKCDCTYADLTCMGIATVMSNFHRLRRDTVVCKGHNVTRKPIGE